MTVGKKVTVDILVNGERIKYFDSFSLNQLVGEHHHFVLRFPVLQRDACQPKGVEWLIGLTGAPIATRFGIGEEQSEFLGIVNKVWVDQDHVRSYIVLEGKSRTYLLEGGAVCNCYSESTLSQVVNKCVENIVGNLLEVAVNPKHEEPVVQLIQYEENSFNFLRRLSYEYRESFYFDGSILHFGFPEKRKKVCLSFGHDLWNQVFSVSAIIPKIRRSFYNAEEHKTYVYSNHLEGGMPEVLKQSAKLFKDGDSLSSKIALKDGTKLESLVTREGKALLGTAIKLAGISVNTNLCLGAEIVLGDSFGNPSLFSVPIEFIVTELKHYIDRNGMYYCTFEAMEAASEGLHDGTYVKPTPGLQRAKVINNKDPKQQGRICVQFDWDAQVNDRTGWLRVMTPNGGGSDQLKMNRGFVAIPEEGDQVLVGFEEGNLHRPIVLGCLFHGKNGQGGGDKNRYKSFASRSGSIIKFDDEEGSIEIKDAKGNVLTMDGKGEIVLETSEKLMVKTKHVELNVSEKLVMSTKDMELNASEKLVVKTKSMDLKPSDKFSIETKDMNLKPSDLDIEANKVSIKAPSVDFS